MKILISIAVVLISVYYIIGKDRRQSNDSQDISKTQKAISFISFIVLVLIISGAWGFAIGAIYQLYSFPKEHSLVFYIASLLILIVAFEIMNFIRERALKTILK